MPRGQRIPYEENHRINNEGEIEKNCNICNKWILMNDKNFYINKKNKTDGYYPNCIICEIERAKIWREKHPELCKEYHRRENTKLTKRTKERYRKSSKKRLENGKYYEWIRNNPDKQKKYIENHRFHDITNREWSNCKEYFNNECAYCGLSLEEHRIKYKQQFHKEHVDHEGYNDVRNCVPACKSCNGSKYIFIMEKWYRKQEYFNENRLIKIKNWCEEDYKQYIEEKPPYIIKRKQNEDKRTYHYEL